MTNKHDTFSAGNIAGSEVMKSKDAPHYIPGTVRFHLSLSSGLTCQRSLPPLPVTYLLTKFTHNADRHRMLYGR